MYMKLVIDKAMAEMEDTQEKQHEATRSMNMNKGSVRRGCHGGLLKDEAVQAPFLQPPLVTDSEWLDLSAEEQLAWAKNIQDPRIAVGSCSPLEKKIKSLGGVQSSEVRKLLVQRFQQENKTLHKLKAMSFDFWFAKVEAHYYRQYQEMIKEEAWRYKMVPKWEIKVEEQEERAHGEESEVAKKWDYLVSERELNHIEKHIHRAERARGLRDHKYRLLSQRIPREILFPKILTLEKDEKNENIQKTHKTKTKKYKMKWAKEQMKGHQDRMIRGRELTEQRNDQKDSWKLSSHVPPFLKSQVEKEEVKEFEWITAYPIFQPYQEALIKVTILVEKSKQEDKIKKPLRRELLSMPPFLRSQLEKNKV
ncbi:golgin subfamily A member 6-like protein 22 [Tupaia chinensis]|uniref:golgin subfamily A member 6-like protein 22 n=1 Tax=Tupaia chinensis TaxID=246437 RepID=UPI0003C8CA6E|nr:golgin subfamily A member 6-like protein 22 [Tupaia chinensis]